MRSGDVVRPKNAEPSQRGLVLRHRKYGAGERAVGLSQLIQDRKVIGVDLLSLKSGPI